MDHKIKRHHGPDKLCLIGATVLGFFAAAFLTAGYLGIAEIPIFMCNNYVTLARKYLDSDFIPNTWTELQLNAVVHYATSKEVPQQSIDEIRVSLRVLKEHLPCNFLVFGLGLDSVMWASLNPGGITVFLEEDPEWIRSVLSKAPYLQAYHVKYRTQLSDSDRLLSHYQVEPDCWPEKSFLRGNEKCQLALNMLADNVHNTEWDLIMIDAPRGYFPEAPGRMAAIYSAAVMTRKRKGPGSTHVFLHDVDREVEDTYSKRFLCKKYLVEEVGRLRHYEILPSTTTSSNNDFC